MISDDSIDVVVSNCVLNLVIRVTSSNYLENCSEF